MTFNVKFIDSGRFPQCKPDPKYPDGRHIDVSDGAAKSCTRNLPYPALRVGVYLVQCLTCGLNVALTVAGRPDDPKIVTMACTSLNTAISGRRYD